MMRVKFQDTVKVTAGFYEGCQGYAKDDLDPKVYDGCNYVLVCLTTTAKGKHNLNITVKIPEKDLEVIHA